VEPPPRVGGPLTWWAGLRTLDRSRVALCAWVLPTADWAECREEGPMLTKKVLVGLLLAAAALLVPPSNEGLAQPAVRAYGEGGGIT